VINWHSTVAGSVNSVDRITLCVQLHRAIKVDSTYCAYCTVNAKFKVTLHRQVRYRGTLITVLKVRLQSVTQLDTMAKSTMTETYSAVLRSRRNCSSHTQQSYLLLFGIPSPTHSFFPGLVYNLPSLQILPTAALPFFY